MTNNLTSQAATMQLNGVPNDIITNLNPISIIIFIPLMDKIIYPLLRKLHINFSPIKRITMGFFLASLAMVSSTVIQYYIYQKHPFGEHPNDAPDGVYAPINVWVQTVPYALIGFSEIMASITSLYVEPHPHVSPPLFYSSAGLSPRTTITRSRLTANREYAFTKAPTNMRSMVQAICLLMNAFSSALAQALVALSEDPLLIWNYGVVAVLAFAGGVGFWLSNYQLDREEDSLNMLGAGDERNGKDRGILRGAVRMSGSDGDLENGAGRGHDDQMVKGSEEKDVGKSVA